MGDGVGFGDDGADDGKIDDDDDSDDESVDDDDDDDSWDDDDDEQQRKTTLRIFLKSVADELCRWSATPVCIIFNKKAFFI